MSRNVLLYFLEKSPPVARVTLQANYFYIASCFLQATWSPDCPVYILQVMHVMLEAQRQEKEQEYEILPWVFLCSTGMIALLYMHACTPTVNQPWNYTQSL